MDAKDMDLLLSNYKNRLGPFHTQEAALEAALQLKLQNRGQSKLCPLYQQRDQRRQELERFAGLLGQRLTCPIFH